MCVLGPNGGGKTTLFRTVLGLLDKHAGNIRLDDQPLENLSRSAIAAPRRLCAAGARRLLRLHGAGVRADGTHGTSGHFFVAYARRDAGRGGAGARVARDCAPRRQAGHRNLRRRAPARAGGARAGAGAASCWCSTSPPRAWTSATRCGCCERISALAATGISILFSSHDPDHAFLCAPPRAAARRGPRTRDRRAARGDPARYARAALRRIGAR